MKHVPWVLLLLLVALHQSGLFSDDTTLVFGFLPINLLFHAGISCAAAFAWCLATKYAWPSRLDEATVESSDEEASA